jgi:outer membrane protein OmpA-like peptidoglycan-associated protein
MKVYIVVAGQYSDYHIERVFLDKEKADRYVELSQTMYNYDSPYIKTMETSDDYIIEKITYVDVYYTKGKDYEDIDVDILNTNTIDSTEDSLKRNEFYSYPSGTKELDISRVIYGDFDEDEIKEKYKKVCQDLMSQIDSLIEIEGWTETMIDEWLGQNVDKYLK